MNTIFGFHNQLNIKKVIIVASIIIFIITFILVSNLKNDEKQLKKQEDANPYKTYTSLNKNISIEFPKRYNLQEKQTNMIMHLESNDGLFINVEEEPIVFGKSLKEVSSSDRDLYYSKFESSFELSELKEFSLENSNTLSSYTYSFKQTNQNSTYIIQVFWIQANTCYYVINVSYPEENSSKYQYLESEIISSFKMD